MLPVYALLCYYYAVLGKLNLLTYEDTTFKVKDDKGIRSVTSY